MKFKKKIANQTIEFLKNGKFRKSNSENWTLSS
jgi:hypothetical protein